jgi:signal transduction histidine kinase
MLKVWKLTPAIALGTVIVLLITGVLIVWYSERSAAEQKINEVSVQSQILASTVIAALTFDDRVAAQEYVSALKINPEIEVAAIYSDRNEIFASYSRNGELLPVTPRLSGHYFEGNHLIVVTPIVQGQRILGAVYLGTIVQPLATRLQKYVLIAVLVITGSLMIAVLSLTQATLKRSNQTLEQRVRERTEDLTATNAALESEITEHSAVSERLRQSQKMESVGRLTGGVAHDFNNLLTIIMGNLELVREEVEDNPHLAKLIDAALSAGQRGADLNQRLLAFSRRQALEPQSTDINERIADLVPMLVRTLGETIEIRQNLAPALWKAVVDPSQFDNSILNLAVNARDAMPHGGWLKIITENESVDQAYAAQQENLIPGDYVKISVCDCGSGMPREVIAKAFEPFFTTKGIGKGTGLGLSMIYGFAKQSGGHVGIYSEVGVGTTITMLLPKDVGDRHEVVEFASGHAAQKTGSELVLVVEDDLDVRAVTVAFLKLLGYRTLEAGRVQEGITAIEQHPEIDLLLTDVILPGGEDGGALARQARKLRPKLRVLFTSGYTEDIIMHQGRLDPGVILLHKPFTKQQLAEKVRSVLDGLLPAPSSKS